MRAARTASPLPRAALKETARISQGISGVNQKRLVTSAEQMPKQFVPPVEASAVGAQKPFHPRHQIPPRCFHHHMKVIGGVRHSACSCQPVLPQASHRVLTNR